MALSDDQVLAAWTGQDERFMRPILGKNKILTFARAIEAEVRKDDEVLIRQLVDALESQCGVRGQEESAAIAAGRARLEQPCA